MSRFPVHGDVAFELGPQVLIIRMSFPFNREASEKYDPEFRRHYGKLKGTKWGSVLVTTGTPLMSGEIRQSAIDSIQESIQHGCVCTACIMLDNDFSSTMQSYWDDIYQTAGLHYVFLTSEKEGVDWVRHYLGHIS